MKRFTVLLAAGLVLAACGGGGDTATEGGEGGEPIRIGFVGDFSDVYSFYDVPVRDGAQFAIDEINAEGGVLGRQLELTTEDGRNDQALTLQLTEELLDSEPAYLIGTTSDPYVAQGIAACAAGVPISTGDGTAPTLVGDAGECAFQLVMSDNIQAGVAAQYARDQGYETAFLLRSTEVPYTGNLPTYFEDAFTELGGDVLGEEEFRIDAGDYSAQVTTIANLAPAPDVIFTPMFLPDTPVFMRQLRAAGVDIPVLSTDGNHDAALLDAGDAVEGLTFTTHGLPAEGNELEGFFSAYEEAEGEAPASVVYGVGYDEIYMLAGAIEAAGSAEPAAIAEALAGISEFEGVTGEVTMDAGTRRAAKTVTLVQVTDGELTLVDSFLPEYVPEVE